MLVVAVPVYVHSKIPSLKNNWNVVDRKCSVMSR